MSLLRKAFSVTNLPQLLYTPARNRTISVGVLGCVRAETVGRDNRTISTGVLRRAGANIVTRESPTSILKRQFGFGPFSTMFGLAIAAANLYNIPNPWFDWRTFRLVLWSLGKSGIYYLTSPVSFLFVLFSYLILPSSIQKHLHPMSVYGQEADLIEEKYRSRAKIIEGEWRDRKKQ